MVRGFLKIVNIVQITMASTVEAGLFTIGETSLPEWQLEEFSEYRAARLLNALAPPALFAVGVTGNTMTLMVLTFSELRHTACCKYLAAVALADTMVLILNFVFNFVDQFVHKVRQSDAACKLYYFLFFTSAHLSSWLLVAVTAQRCLVIRRPMTSFFVTSNRCTLCVIGGLTAASVMLNSHHVVIRELGWSNVTQQRVCQARGGGSEVFVRDYWRWVDAAVYSFLPASFLLVFNTVIIRTLRKAAVFRKRHQRHQGRRRKVPDVNDCGSKSRRGCPALVSGNERTLALAEVSENPEVSVSDNERSLTLAAVSENPEVSVSDNERSLTLVAASDNPEVSVSDNELSLNLAAVSDNLEVSLSDNERPLTLAAVSENPEVSVSDNERPLALAAVSENPVASVSDNEHSFIKVAVSINPALLVSGSEHVSASAPFPANPVLLSETGNPLTSASSSDRPCFVSETEDPLSSAPFSVSSVSESEQRLSPVSVSQHSFSCAQSSGSIKACSAASSSWTVGDRPQPPTDTASNASQQKERQNQSRQLTLMPLLASLLFVTLSAPIAFTLVMEQQFWQRDTPQQVIRPDASQYGTCSHSLALVADAVSFVLSLTCIP